MPPGQQGDRRQQDICVRFGTRIRRLRERLGWDQADLAAASGVSRETISRIENGRTQPNLRTQEYLAQSFGLSMAQLMRGV